MSRISEIFDYMRTCPSLTDLFSIGATDDIGVSVILPQGSSEAVRYDEFIDVTGAYNCDVVPYPSVYEDFQINMYKWYDERDTIQPSGNSNVLSYDEVQAVCDWVIQQNEARNLPTITGVDVVSVEVNPFVPQIRFVDTEQSKIGYFITLRIRYVNKRKAMAIEI